MDLKQKYLCRELDILAWNASVQRAGVYVKGLALDDPLKKQFRTRVSEFMADQILPRYAVSVVEPEHCENIDRLSKHATDAGGELLEARLYRFGVAQKLLNLTLKYHWCLGLIPEPPHCPVDRIVLDRTWCKGMNWTQINSCEHYLLAINAIREIANRDGHSIAMWELTSYARR